MTCHKGNSMCQACIDNTNSKTFAALSPEAKFIFRLNYQDPVSSRSVLGSSVPLRTSPCNHPDGQTACTATQPKLSWRAYISYGIFGFTMLISIISVILAFKMKSSAAKKFNTLKEGTHPSTGRALDPSKEATMRQTRDQLYKMTGAR